MVHVAVQYSADIDFVVKPEAMWIIVVEGAPVERSLFVARRRSKRSISRIFDARCLSSR